MLHLVRHAAHVLQDRVMVGRTRGVALSAQGRAQAAALAATFAGQGVDAVLSSPRQRARETAAAIATATRAPIEIAGDLDEVDLGEWTGRTLEELAPDPRWRYWNESRAAATCPGGEAMAAVWRRIERVLHTSAERYPSGTVVLVTHAEPIRATVLACTGRSFDRWSEVEIATASVTTLRSDSGRLVYCEDAGMIAA